MSDERELAWGRTSPAAEGWYWQRAWVLGRKYRGRREPGRWGLPNLVYAYERAPGVFYYRAAGSPVVYVVGRRVTPKPDEWIGPIDISAWPPWDDGA